MSERAIPFVIATFLGFILAGGLIAVGEALSLPTPKRPPTYPCVITITRIVVDMKTARAGELYPCWMRSAPLVNEAGRVVEEAVKRGRK